MGFVGEIDNLAYSLTLAISGMEDFRTKEGLFLFSLTNYESPPSGLTQAPPFPVCLLPMVPPPLLNSSLCCVQSD